MTSCPFPMPIFWIAIDNLSFSFSCLWTSVALISSHFSHLFCSHLYSWSDPKSTISFFWYPSFQYLNIITHLLQLQVISFIVKLNPTFTSGSTIACSCPWRWRLWRVDRSKTGKELCWKWDVPDDWGSCSLCASLSF